MTNAPESGATAVKEIDEVTGQETTGHVWDGIRELNRPLPRWWLWTFYATIAWSALWVVLYPAIPLIKGATGGLLGYSTRAAVEERLNEARTAQSVNLDRVASMSLQEIAADADLMRFAVSGGRSAFLVNCVQCHGSGAAGSAGYPNLNDDDWLWGGSLEKIHQTISFGIRSGHPDAHFSEMPKFGDILSRGEVRSITEYVLSLSDKQHDATLASEGKPLFEANCAACHGPEGAGMVEVGAPALNDAIALYAGDRAAISAQMSNPRHGVMPAWSGRLDPVVIKELALYVYSLGGGEAAN